MNWELALQIGGVASLVLTALWFVYGQGQKQGKDKAKDDQLVKDVAEMKDDLKQLKNELAAHVQTDNERFEQVQKEQSRLHSVRRDFDPKR